MRCIAGLLCGILMASSSSAVYLLASSAVHLLSSIAVYCVCIYIRIQKVRGLVRRFLVCVLVCLFVLFCSLSGFPYF